MDRTREVVRSLLVLAAVGGLVTLGARTRLAHWGRVRAGREKRIVLRLSRRTLQTLRQSARPIRVQITVTGRTAAGARKTVSKRALIAPGIVEQPDRAMRLRLTDHA